MNPVLLKKTCANCKFHDGSSAYLTSPLTYKCMKVLGTHRLNDVCEKFEWNKECSEEVEVYDEVVIQLERIADALEEINERMKWNK